MAPSPPAILSKVNIKCENISAILHGCVILRVLLSNYKLQIEDMLQKY